MSGQTRIVLRNRGGRSRWRFTLDVLLKMPGVQDVRSSLALEVVKDSTALPLESSGMTKDKRR